MAHAVLSPSSADRWMVCPGSVALTKDMPDTSSAFAAEGTLAHALAERALLDGNEPRGYIGMTGAELGVDEALTDKVTPEMADFVTVYTTLVRDLMGGSNG